MSSQCVRLRSHRTFFSGVPTLPELLSADRRKATPAAPLVSIQHAFGSNYYHLVVDCLGALALIDEHDELADSHIVVGPDLAETSAFAEMVELGVIPRDRLIVRRERWITSDQPIAFVQQEALTAHALRRTAAYVARVTPPASDRGVESKLYVTRGLGGFGRGLRNEAELVLALERRDFEVIDPGSLSWEEQHVRFRAATHVVGVHGAALTNILYRWPSALSLLEISAPGQTAEVFKMMAGSLDYRFARVDGSAPRGRGDRPSFVVDVAALLDIVDGWEKNNVGAGAPPGVPPA
jgi:capsular polysaccharide biosynthesis protein